MIQATNEHYLKALGLTRRFGSFTAVDSVDLELASGELLALLGPSGCGKTTLLRMLAGLEPQDAGDVFVEGLSQSGIPITKRNVGFVFQHYALFRHMNVFENVAFGLKVLPKSKRPDKAEIRRRVHELLGLVQLEDQTRKYPDQMSGGQRQRVALARALIVNPKILLLDEPFGALDANVRKELRRWLRRLHDELHITSILVTHDQDEALEVADRIIIMNEGKIEQSGTPEDIYLKPANEFVYKFLGAVNVFHGREKQYFVRPHEMAFSRVAVKDYMPARVSRIGFSGASARLEVKLQQDQQLVEVMLPLSQYKAQRPRVDDLVYISPTEYREFSDYQI
ncbi:sulfate/molybdate ABC transporter ATP-binding protein [Spirochaeta dissipatitropha]